MKCAEKMGQSSVLAAYGPEVRAFIHNGFLRSGSEEIKPLIFTYNKDSQILNKTGYEIRVISEVAEPYILEKLRNLNNRIAEIRLNRMGHDKWRHSIVINNQESKRDSILNFRLVIKPVGFILRLLENIVEKICSSRSTSMNILKNSGISVLYYSAYSDRRSNSMIASAKEHGIKTVLVPNSWKDFYTRPRISPVPDEIWVLDEATKSNYLKINSRIDPSAIKIRNSLHIDSLKKYSEDSSKSVSSVIAIDPDKPFICYTTAAPNAVVSEELIVKGIAEKLCAEGIQVLVRVNPMEIGNRFESALKGIDGVFINRPDWEWNRGLDWCCASSEDCELWAMVLKEMKLNISIPSTVTLEAIAFGKPVVNVAYDAPNAVDPAHSNLRYWNSSFYESMREHHSVHKATNIDELLQKVVKLIN